jgi:NAD(P)H-hydrate repair Nnr-like enzyme with NAD(P)H-hydrate epimerase domain
MGFTQLTIKQRSVDCHSKMRGFAGTSKLALMLGVGQGSVIPENAIIFWRVAEVLVGSGGVVENGGDGYVVVEWAFQRRGNR